MFCIPFLLMYYFLYISMRMYVQKHFIVPEAALSVVGSTDAMKRVSSADGLRVDLTCATRAPSLSYRYTHIVDCILCN